MGLYSVLLDVIAAPYFAIIGASILIPAALIVAVIALVVWMIRKRRK